MRYICTSIVATLVLAGTSFAAESALAWGSNQAGQCDVPAEETFVQVAAGALHTIGHRADGTALAWGDNGQDQCDVPVDETFMLVASGGYHSIGLTGIPTGVCCVSSGCDVLTEDQCTNLGGSGILVGNCDDCAPAEPTGVCCVSSGCFAGTMAQCTEAGGTFLSVGGSCDDCPASCAGDTDGDGVITTVDLLNMLEAWGPCP